MIHIFVSLIICVYLISILSLYTLYTTVTLATIEATVIPTISSSFTVVGIGLNANCGFMQINVYLPITNNKL